MEDLIQGKRVTVFGLGLNQGGVGTVQFLASHGAREIVVTDSKTAEMLTPSIEALKDIPNIRYVLGEHHRGDFINTDLVIKNPAIPWTNEFVRAAQEASVPVEIDASLFFQFCRGTIIGVTGTKGKTTTATLLAFLLRSSSFCHPESDSDIPKKTVVEVGIGQTPVLSLLDWINEDTLVVFELSSWRLSALHKHQLSPHIAIFTNFFADHLNYYSSMDDYFEDKRMICVFQKSNDIFVHPSGKSRFAYDCGEGKKLGFSLDDTGVNPLVFFRGDSIVYRDETGKEETLFDRSQILLLPGKHNRNNILAATAGALMAGVPAEDIRVALPKFTGVRHRLERVREWHGVEWYNDTTATVPEATEHALESFSKPIILIAGGADKNLDFTRLAQTLEIHPPKAMILFQGDATEKLLEVLRRQKFDIKNIELVDSMVLAVNKAKEKSQSGDVVLLSPGAASFGIFRNEFDRGDQFRDLVLNFEE